MTASKKRDLRRLMLLAALSLFSVGVAFSACSDSNGPDEQEKQRELDEREREVR